MRLPGSLQTRLALMLGLGIAIVWTVATIFTSLSITHEMGQVFDASLKETAQRILPLAEQEISDRSSDDDDFTLEETGLSDDMLVYIITDSGGSVRLRSRDTDAKIFQSATTDGFSNGPTHRLYRETNARGTLTIIIADPLSHRQEATSEAFVALISPLAYLVPLSMLGVWLVVRFSFRSLRRIRSEIEARGSGDLSPIFPENMPAEIKPVLNEVNNLMKRVARAIESERNFAANSAHELRTPIAAALAQTQRLIAESSDLHTRERAIQVETALNRLAALSEKLMQLAKSEGAALIGTNKSDLVPVLDLVVEDFLRLGHEAERIRIQRPQGAVMASIDPNAFAILLRNLIENGLRHGDPDKPVSVYLSPMAELRVRSPGPEIPRQTLDTLTRPFVRGNTMASGTGLGLAIVASIAKGIGGSIALHAPMRNGESGLEVVVNLV